MTWHTVHPPSDRQTNKMMTVKYHKQATKEVGEKRGRGRLLYVVGGEEALPAVDLAGPPATVVLCYHRDHIVCKKVQLMEKEKEKREKKMH